LFGLIKDIAFALGPFGALATIAAIAIWWKGKQDAAKLEELKTEGRRLISEGKISQGSEKLREAAYLESSGTAFTMGPGAGTAISPIIQRYNDEIKRLTDEYYRNNPSKAKEITESVYNATKPFTTPASQLPAGTISSPNPVNPLAPPVKKAQGGLITGPGSETSDSIPTRLSNGEFVVKADSVKKIGTDLLNKLNFGGKGALENAMYGAAPLSMMMRDLFRSDTGKAVVDSLDTVASVTSPLGDLLDSTRTGGKLGMFSDIVSGVDATYALSRGQYKKAGNVALEFAKGKTVQSFLSRLRIPGPVGLVAGMGAQQTYSAYQQQKKMPHNQGKNLLFYTGRDYGAMPEVRHPVGTGNTFLDKAFGAYSRFYKKDQQPGMLPPVKVTAPRYHKGGIVGGDKTELPAILQRGEAVLSKLQIGSLSNLIGKFNTIAGLGGKLSDNVSGLKEKALGFATSKIPGIGGILGGGLGGLKEKALGFATSKIPGLSGVMDVYKQGGLKGVGTSLLNKGVGALGKKVPGLSGAMSAISAFKTGGVKSALGSLTKGGIGKAIGGAIGTAIPIPGVGTMIGSMLGSKLTNLASGLFKKKTKAPGIDGMGMAPATEGFDISNVFRSMIGQSMGQSTAQQPVNVDTSGIEQKLNNFINALQNIQINMDGTQVGKVLVNASDAAMSAGVFRAQTSR
jgi:hypothetical protein